jgi:hypothetical protein
MMMHMMRAGFRGTFQLPAQKRGGKNFDPGARWPGVDRDVMARTKLQRPPAHPSGNHRMDAQLPQPAGKQTRLMWRRRNICHPEHDPFGGVNVNQREFPAAAKMVVQPLILHRHRNADGLGCEQLGRIRIHDLGKSFNSRQL